MHELLVPAGNLECVKIAVTSGADAVYAGLKSFGARKFANNLSEDEVIEALKICHLYNKKLYITMNTLVKDNEVEEFLKQIEFLHKIGIDAILMQDFGMICLVRQMYPNLEIHASTQANSSSLETIKMFYEMGIKRVVLSRELSLDEIKSINIPVDLEAFMHGALCVSYSGRCLMSSMIGGRSGNRGECAGSCRLPYSLLYQDKLIESNKYLLSMKELNTSSRINDLLKSNIYSFKIEGRMKSKEYVSFITRYYRHLIDNDKDFDLKEETNKLKTIFNRKFTKGHLFNTKDNNLINNNTPNHIGLEIGKVISVTNQKIKIKLNRKLNQNDGIRFLESGNGMMVNFLYDEKGKLTNTSNDICYVDNKINLKTNDTVSKTFDYELSKEIENYKDIKVPVEINLLAKKNNPLKITIIDNNYKVELTGNIVDKAINQPISKDRIEKQVSKLGDTPFTAYKINIDCDDDIFISIKELNDLRREAVNELINKKTLTDYNIVKKIPTFDKDIPKLKKEFCVKVLTEDSLLECLKFNIDKIYVLNKDLYEKFKYKENIYNVEEDSKFIFDKKTLTNNYQDFNNQDGDYGLNVYNIYTAYFLFKMGLNKVTLSPELSFNEQMTLKENFEDKFDIEPNLEILAYGRIENMIIKGNILSIKENDFNYSLIDLRKRKFPVYYDGRLTHILNSEPLSIEITNNIKNNFNIRIDFSIEDKQKINKIVNQYY